MSSAGAYNLRRAIEDGDELGAVDGLAVVATSRG